MAISSEGSGASSPAETTTAVTASPHFSCGTPITATQVKTDATLFVRVDGHTDSDPVKKLKTKGINDNIHLSTMRAMAVRDFLVSKGVPQDRVFVAGFGEFWPIAAGKSAKDKQRNRRVEVYLGDPDALSIGALPGAQVAK